ncbi:Protoheme IX farnesyltransferase, mitochondrial [Irineochytrium annulatum]|nr:Protoheme IX farnesyltransferase, mitochondrial [Irineochytrium annulatum]
MMGWAASTGGLDIGAWILGGILFSWQFPHFNSLSWSLQADYAKAGYRMMSVVDPALNARVSLRHALLLFPISLAAPYIGMTTWWFAVSSSVLNTVFAYGAWKFFWMPSDKTARELFFISLIHLPVLLGLLMFHKQKEQAKGSNRLIANELTKILNASLRPFQTPRDVVETMLAFHLWQHQTPSQVELDVDEEVEFPDNPDQRSRAEVLAARASALAA